MIFPFFRGLLPPHLAPATWFLLSVNLFVFMVNLPQFLSSQQALDNFFQNTDFMRTQGFAFSQFVQDEPLVHSRFLRKMADRATSGDQVSQVLMGGYAVRNRTFMESAGGHEFEGDIVALNLWKKEFADLRNVQLRHPTYKWGLSAARPTWINWISYQFSHSGFQHLLWNMIFLLLFASFLESLVGSHLVILVYVLSGLLGAGVFALASGLSHSPLIGASGAVSGLMACLAVYLWQEKARFFYWLLPVPGYFGFRELPAWIIVIVYLIPDLAGQISSISDVNGLAYSAHLGGAALGALAGYGLRVGWLAKDEAPPPAEEIW